VAILQQGQGLIGLALILVIAWGLSEDRKAMPGPRWIAGALGMQIVMALVFVRVPVVWQAVGVINHGVEAIEKATLAGSSYMFGYLGGRTCPSC